MKPWTEQEIMNIWNITPNLHTNSHFEMKAEKWTIMQETSGPKRRKENQFKLGLCALAMGS